MNHNRVKAEVKRVVNATRRVKRAEKMLTKAIRQRSVLLMLKLRKSARQSNRIDTECGNLI